MKKVFAILILLTLTVAAVFPMAAFAEETSGSTTTDTTNLRLVNPVAICAVENKLFIADNITENNSIVLCFDVTTENSPKYLFVESVENPIVNLSETNGKLAVIHADGVNKYEISDDGLTLNNEGSHIVNAAGVVDVTYGHVTFKTNEYPTEFFIGEDAKFKSDNGDDITPLTDTPNPKACLEFENNVYFLYQDDSGKTMCKRFSESGTAYNKDEAFNTNTTLDLNPKGILGCKVGDDNKLVLYSDTSLCFMTAKNDNSAFYFESANTLFNYTELTKKEDSQLNNKIVDACSNGSKVFVLNDKNEVEIFSQTPSEDGGWKFVLETATIGTDTIKLNDISLPKVDDFNSYTLAKSKGYPTNIVYKTENGDTSIEDIKTDYSDTFIILGFEGAENLPFYYVLVGNRFGWVKKSDNVTVAENDENIERINTTSNFLVGSIPVDVTQKAKFISAGNVYVFHLPVKKLADDTSMKDTFSQTLDTTQDVIVLQKFTEKTETGDVVWYYVEYGEGKRGFVQEGTIGKFYTAAADEGIPYIDDMKINASLFEGVKIYISEDMTENEGICDAEGNVLKLRSGAKVKAIKQNADGTKTYIEVTQNGETSYGWISTENLIGRHNVTTNAAVGLCILAAASFCALVLLLLFKYRNKKNEFEEE